MLKSSIAGSGGCSERHHDRSAQLPASALAAAAAATTTETLQLLNDDDSMEIPHDTTTDEENDSDLDIPYETGHEPCLTRRRGSAKGNQ
jgi:hypothetical protein